jgi:DNA-binding NarL/FixJ family response regulator
MKKVFIVDDHSLFSRSLGGLINSFEDYHVDFYGSNGEELIEELTKENAIEPDIILLDVKMPIMNGIETMRWLKIKRPNQKVLILTMEDDEVTIMQMIKLGIRGYLLKDIEPAILQQALNEVYVFGYYQNEALTKNVNQDFVKLKDKELEFLQYASTELTYKEIAEQMNLSPKTIDGYREDLFDKLNVKSRVSLVIYGIKHNLIKV